MSLLNWLSVPKNRPRFDSDEALFKGLRDLDNAAIVHLQTRALPLVKKIVRQYGLPADHSEDILNQSTLIFLRKIETGAYQFQGYSPTTYLIEIARRVTLSARKAQQKNGANELLEHHSDLQDPDVAVAIRRQESAELVQVALERLGAPCNQIIRLHHIDGYSDEEVVNQQLTKYSTVNSLKMKRSDCMKKLSKLVKRERF